MMLSNARSSGSSSSQRTCAKPPSIISTVKGRRLREMLGMLGAAARRGLRRAAMIRHRFDRAKPLSCRPKMLVVSCFGASAAAEPVAGSVLDGISVISASSAIYACRPNDISPLCNVRVPLRTDSRSRWG